MEAECATVLRDFFAERRAAHKARQAALRPAQDDEAIPVAEVVAAADDAIPVGVATEIDEPSTELSQDPRGATR
jgi:hypothetical protein